MKLIKLIFAVLLVGALCCAGYAFLIQHYAEARTYLLWALGYWCGIICVEWMGTMEEASEQQTKLLEEISAKLNNK